MSMILLVEDDPIIIKSLSITLSIRGFEVVSASSVKKAIEEAKNNIIDLVLLDINLPDGSGYDFCKIIRQKYKLLPILMLTARTDEASVVKGLTLGADDYVRKPFGLEELVARIKRLLGRGIEQKNILSFASIKMNLNNRVVFIGDKKINLVKREFEVLEVFLKKAGQDITRDSIMSVIDDEGKIFDRTLDSHISHLRSRLKNSGAYDVKIVSVYGIGYRLERT